MVGSPTPRRKYQKEMNGMQTLKSRIAMYAPARNLPLTMVQGESVV